MSHPITLLHLFRHDTIIDQLVTCLLAVSKPTRLRIAPLRHLLSTCRALHSALAPYAFRSVNLAICRSKISHAIWMWSRDALDSVRELTIKDSDRRTTADIHVDTAILAILPRLENLTMTTQDLDADALTILMPSSDRSACTSLTSLTLGSNSNMLGFIASFPLVRTIEIHGLLPKRSEVLVPCHQVENLHVITWESDAHRLCEMFPKLKRLRIARDDYPNNGFSSAEDHLQGHQDLESIVVTLHGRFGAGATGHTDHWKRYATETKTRIVALFDSVGRSVTKSTIWLEGVTLASANTNHTSGRGHGVTIMLLVKAERGADGAVDCVAEYRTPDRVTDHAIHKEGWHAATRFLSEAEIRAMLEQTAAVATEMVKQAWDVPVGKRNTGRE